MANGNLHNWVSFGTELIEPHREEPNAISILRWKTEKVIATYAAMLFVMIMAGIYEHTIHRFLRERGGSASKREIYKALGDDDTSRTMIDEKLSMMERFGLVIIDGEEVKVK